jgi:GT2 family glycosyltransferase
MGRRRLADTVPDAEKLGTGCADALAIVVNYNAGKWLRECVESVLRSSCGPEIVVVDNASSDDSLARLDDCASKMRIVHNSVNVGFSRANNQVMKSHRAAFYVLINPDCIVEQDTIATVIDAMQSDRSIGLASCLIRNADGSVQKTCRRRFPTPSSALARTIGMGRLQRGGRGDFDYGGEGHAGGVEYVDAVSGAFMVARGSAVDVIGHLDEGYFMHCEDLDWCKRFWQGGFKVAFVADACVTHVKGASGRSLRVNWHLHQGMLRFYRKFYLEEYPRILYPLIVFGVYASFVGRSTKLLFGGRNSNASGA